MGPRKAFKAFRSQVSAGLRDLPKASKAFRSPPVDALGGGCVRWWTRWVAEVSGGARVGWRKCPVVDALEGECDRWRTRWVADVSGGGRDGGRV